MRLEHGQSLLCKFLLAFIKFRIGQWLQWNPFDLSWINLDSVRLLASSVRKKKQKREESVVSDFFFHFSDEGGKSGVQFVYFKMRSFHKTTNKYETHRQSENYQLNYLHLAQINFQALFSLGSVGCFCVLWSAEAAAAVTTTPSPAAVAATATPFLRNHLVK